MHDPTETYCTMTRIGEHIHRAGLWPVVPSRSTVYKWWYDGLIVTHPGIQGRPVVDIPATLAKLRNPYVLP